MQALSIAIQRNDTQAVERVLAKYPKAPRDMIDYQGQMLLHKACDVGNADIVRLLLGHSALVNHVDESSQTPLLIAASRGNAPIVDLLLSSGADPNGVPSATRSLSVARLSNEIGVPLCAAAIAGSAPCVQRLLRAKADVNLAEPSLGGSTALHCAVQGQNVTLVRALLRHGADARAVNQQGESILEIAEDLDSEEILDLVSQALRLAGIEVTPPETKYARDPAPMKPPCRLVWLPSRGEIRARRQDLRDIPEEASMAEGVRSLILSGNRIRSLASLSSLLNLEVLNLSENALETLPMDLGLCGSLRSLILDGNKLSELPRCLGSLRDLRVLSLANNDIRQLTGSVLSGMRNLARLVVSHNQLSQLPEEIRNLQRLQLLDVSHNHLTSLPSVVGECTQLRKILANANELHAVPTSLARLPHLACLLLDDNPLDNLYRNALASGGLQALLSLLDPNRPRVEIPPLPAYANSAAALDTHSSPPLSPASRSLTQSPGILTEEPSTRSEIDSSEASDEEATDSSTSTSAFSADSRATSLVLEAANAEESNTLAADTPHRSSSDPVAADSTAEKEKKLERMKQKRTNIAKEILETERGYVQSLTKLVEVCSQLLSINQQQQQQQQQQQDLELCT